MNKHTAQETPAMITENELDAAFAERERQQEREGFLSDPDYRQVRATNLVQTYFRSGEELSEQQQESLKWVRDYAGSFDFLNEMNTKVRAGTQLSEKQVDAIARCHARELDKLADAADALLDEFHGKLAPAAPASEPVLEAGFFEHDGRIYKVQRAVHGSGNLYAKVLEIDEASSKGRFEYAPGIIRQLNESERLTIERAKELGHLYGMCCICGATLTDERSIEAGIGPVCAGRI